MKHEKRGASDSKSCLITKSWRPSISGVFRNAYLVGPPLFANYCGEGLPRIEAPLPARAEGEVMAGRPSKEANDRQAAAAAATVRAITDDEKARRDAKTARLEQARLAKEAIGPVPAKPKRRTKEKWQR